MEAQELRNRTKKFSISIIRLTKSIRSCEEGRIISRQLIKCSTSVGANYRAACLARSTAEFYAKLCTVVEEADESIYWLELLLELPYLTQINFMINELLKEANELTAILSASRKTVKLKLNKFNNQITN